MGDFISWTIPTSLSSLLRTTTVVHEMTVSLIICLHPPSPSIDFVKRTLTDISFTPTGLSPIQRLAITEEKTCCRYSESKYPPYLSSAHSHTIAGTELAAFPAGISKSRTRAVFHYRPVYWLQNRL